MTFEEFTQEAHALGFATVVARDWPPLEVVAEHTHPFAVHAIVTQGERYGAQGATYWVGRKET